MTIEQVSAYLDDMLCDANMYSINTAVTLYLDNDTQVEVGYAAEYHSFYWSRGRYSYYYLKRLIDEVIKYLVDNDLYVEKVEEV